MHAFAAERAHFERGVVWVFNPKIYPKSFETPPPPTLEPLTSHLRRVLHLTGSGRFRPTGPADSAAARTLLTGQTHSTLSGAICASGISDGRALAFLTSIHRDARRLHTELRAAAAAASPCDPAPPTTADPATAPAAPPPPTAYPPTFPSDDADSDSSHDDPYPRPGGPAQNPTAARAAYQPPPPSDNDSDSSAGDAPLHAPLPLRSPRRNTRSSRLRALRTTAPQRTTTPPVPTSPIRHDHRPSPTAQNLAHSALNNGPRAPGPIAGHRAPPPSHVPTSDPGILRPKTTPGRLDGH